MTNWTGLISINALVTALALWLIRWTALLGALGLVSIVFQVAWLVTIGVVGGVIDLYITLLSQARLAESRARAKETLTKIEHRLRDDNASDNR